MTFSVIAEFYYRLLVVRSVVRPELFAGIGIDVISQLRIRHLDGTRNRIRRELPYT